MAPNESRTVARKAPTTAAPSSADARRQLDEARAALSAADATRAQLESERGSVLLGDDLAVMKVFESRLSDQRLECERAQAKVAELQRRLAAAEVREHDDKLSGRRDRAFVIQRRAGELFEVLAQRIPEVASAIEELSRLEGEFESIDRELSAAHRRDELYVDGRQPPTAWPNARFHDLQQLYLIDPRTGVSLWRPGQ